MSFEMKYLKYKMKYLALKNQIGGIVVKGDDGLDYEIPENIYMDMTGVNSNCSQHDKNLAGCKAPCKVVTNTTGNPLDIHASVVRKCVSAASLIKK
jgi:hypothetical protein